jgi:hypothetical protein
MNALERTDTDTDAITTSLMKVLNTQREDYLNEGHVSARSVSTDCAVV